MATTIGPIDYYTGSRIIYRNFLDQDVEVLVDRQEYVNGEHGFVGMIVGASEDPGTHPIVWGYTRQIVAVVRR